MARDILGMDQLSEVIRDRAPIVSMEGADNQTIGALSLIKIIALDNTTASC
jgi:hypothetical protein